MNIHRKKYIFIALLFFNLLCFGKEGSVISLGNQKKAQLSVDLLGGAFVDFKIAEETINPFSWSIPQKDMPINNQNGAPFQGHFLCLGRWGAPTDGEIKAGVPHNGQAGNQLWTIVEQTKDNFLHIRSIALLDGIVADRKIYFDENKAVFGVVDCVQSTLSVGRLFNIVQHTTIGAPFLSKSTIIDTNADKGFMQHLSFPDPHKYEYVWPKGVIDSVGTIVDLTRSDTSNSYVSTHLFDENIGWVTASSPDCGLMIGYVWKTRDYPWLNVWHEMKNGEPCAKGLEFGTTGIGKSYVDLLKRDTRFYDQNSFFYLDALESFEKSFICFQVKIPSNYKGVKEVKLENNTVIVVEKDSQQVHNIVIETPLVQTILFENK